MNSVRPPGKRPACPEDGGRVGAVQDLEVEAVRLRAEDLAEDLRGEARSAHPEEQGVGEALGPDFAGECLAIRRRCRPPSGRVQPAEAVRDLLVFRFSRRSDRARQMRAIDASFRKRPFPAIASA